MAWQNDPMRLFRRPDGRYYAILDPVPDLFGEPVIVMFHGSIHSRMGGSRSWPAPDIDVDAVARLRAGHGYREDVADTDCP